MICTFYSFVVAHLVHNMLSHSQSLFLHLNHVILFIFWVVNLLQLNEMHRFLPQRLVHLQITLSQTMQNQS